jgi:hypothetical protein
MMPTMPKSVAAKVVAVSRNIKKLHHDKRNEYASYNYVSVDSFYEALGPIMADAGLFVIVDEVSATADKGFLTANYELFLVSEEGDSYGPIHRQVTVKASGPQSYASAQSYAEKYFLRQIFKVPTGEQDADSHEKTILPDIQPQVKQLSKSESAKLMDEVIDKLYEVTTDEQLEAWKKANGSEVKRSLLKEHTEEVTKVFKEVEAKLKEVANG